MIKSRYFWAAALMLAIIPLLIMDISEYYVAWQKEVREPIIEVVQNLSGIDKMQKAEVLDKVFAKNQMLIQRSALNGLASVLLLITGIYLLRRYIKNQRPSFLKPTLTIVGLIIIFIAAKVTLAIAVNSEPGANFIIVNANGTSFKSIIDKNFKDKVVYVDFWGTTCGPCLMEFDNFTQPVKAHYKNRTDLAYLYVANGSRYLWKKQIAKHKVNGSHLFLEYTEYDKLYREALNNDTATVLMPHYLVVDKTGRVVIGDAYRPRDAGKLYAQLDKYLK